MRSHYSQSYGFLSKTRSPLAIGWLAVVIVTCVWLVVLPKFVPEVVPVIPMSSKSCGSKTNTGTATVLNFVLTLARTTVSEINTTRLPVASEFVAALSDLTVTVNAKFSRRVLMALSMVFRVVLPTTKSTVPGEFTVSENCAC